MLTLPFLLDERDVRADVPAPVLLVTRDIRGHLEPCECKDGVLGGFPRRATVVHDTRPRSLLKNNISRALARFAADGLARRGAGSRADARWRSRQAASR